MQSKPCKMPMDHSHRLVLTSLTFLLLVAYHKTRILYIRKNYKENKKRNNKVRSKAVCLMFHNVKKFNFTKSSIT